MTTSLARLRTTLSTQLAAHPLLATSIAVTTTIAVPFLYHDYEAFLALGPGGLPYNAFGWLVNLLLLRPVALSHTARLNVDDYPPASEASAYVRDELSLRKGPRAQTAGIVPHRQMSQTAPQAMAGPLVDMLKGFVTEREGEDVLEIKRSHYELHNDALYVAERLLKGEGEVRRLPATARIAKGEIAHIHGDRSVHLYLHPADARVVIEKGWGERHRLSRTWPWWLGGGEGKLGLGHTWIMLYGARDEEDLEVTRRLIGEGVRWMLGERGE